MDNRDPAVDTWFETYANPQKDLVQAVRRTILDADPRITEAIKWKAPTFMYKGNLASFYPKSTKHVSLMFHTGAALPDPTGLLEGEGIPPGSLGSATMLTSRPRALRSAAWLQHGSSSRADQASTCVWEARLLLACGDGTDP